ncbi:hypothetical protein RF55_23463 [Lasius niger]|uniref:Uncharacterized protein n=1 Tax=Lasius niger TaxID=67767 RepID=A0A0J7JWL2_LASNI|nr:hypothetical protein RF55_23463 [Lasius niger]
MKQLDCKTQPPTKEELNASMKRRAAYEMIASFTVLPIILIDKNEVKDFDEINKEMNKDDYTNPGHKNETYKKIMMKRVPMYDEWGLLDV